MKVQSQVNKQNEELNNYFKRLHRVFRETEDGRLLLEIWENALKMTSGHEYGQELYALGLSEGKKEFVREIILQSKQAEGK